MSSLSLIGPRGTYWWSSHLLVLVCEGVHQDHDSNDDDEDDDGEVDDKFLLNFIRTIIF